MAPYISSHLHDGVWIASLLPEAHLDILQNLVANTRKPRSATTCVASNPWLASPAVDGAQLLQRPAPGKGSMLMADSGWSLWDNCAGGVVALSHSTA